MADSTKVLNLYPIDYPFETLVSRENQGKLILNPDFQRKFKWDKQGNERGSKFIESCLMRIPLPACYFAEDEKGNHAVIDGVQRITTIKNFFNDEFALEGLSIYKELEGKRFSELGDFRAELESTTIRCIVLRKENPKYLVQEIFARLNQGAVTLSYQEIRHAIYPGNLDKLLEELGRQKFIQEFKLGEAGTKLKDSRETDEMVLRFFALNSDLDDYQDKLYKYLDDYMIKNQNISDDDVEQKRLKFNNTLQTCLLVFDNEPFIDKTRSKPRQSLALYDLVMWSFSEVDHDLLLRNKENVQQLFRDLCADGDFTKSLNQGIQNRSSILKRRTLWKEKLDQLV